MDKSTSPAAMRARQELLQHANLYAATDACNRLVSKLFDDLNECGHTIGTSLMCRALIVHAMVDVGASWWAEHGHLPTPVTFEAMWSLARDLPPQLLPVSTDDRDGAPPLR